MDVGECYGEGDCDGDGEGRDGVMGWDGTECR